jgi:hypothetical protein
MLPNGGVALAEQAAYRITVLNEAGKVERIIERPIAPRKGTEKDRQAFMKQRHDAVRQGGGGMMRGRNGSSSAPPPAQAMAALEEEMLRNATWRDVIPVLRRVSADPQGRIWVARTPVDFGSSGPVDLVRADGAYIGTIQNATLPAAVSRSGRAAYVEFDELGVEHVAVKQLPASWK